ncbi:MAG TPA: MarR family transcriptional regulator [Mycobacteriales bacterium]|nr:MarR family transcriptional regulator [Mycobacteriales bacterium]
MTAPAATRTHAETATRLRTAIARLNRRLRQQTVGELTLSQWSALVAVESAGRMRIGDLAAHEHVSAPTATRLVASLEIEGLLGRQVDDDDRRSALISLTDQGRQSLAELRRKRTEALAARLAGLSAADLDHLVRALPVLEQLSG